MRRNRIGLLWVGVFLGSAGAAVAAPKDRAADKSLGGPTPSDLSARAVTLCRSLQEWRDRTHPGETVVLRGPVFVGLENVPAPAASQLAEAWRGELAKGLRSGLRIEGEAPPAGEPDARGTVYYDVRAFWKDGRAGRAGRLSVELVNPRDGKVTAHFEPLAADAAPVATSPSEGRSDLMSAAAAVSPQAGDASVPRRQWLGGSGPPSGAGSVARRFACGVVYFQDADLARRIAILQEDHQIVSTGQSRLRIGLLCRKGKASLTLRCDFYDDQGRAAGTVKGLELKMREGRPATIALVSRRPAASYILFVKD